MARQLHQLAAVQQAFAARIEQKRLTEREIVQERADDIPLVGWLLKPLAGFVFDREQDANARKGERGEESVLDALLRALPESWTIFHNVVVEASPDAFAQIDLLAIGPAGLLLIETKAWRGSYRAQRDRWQHRAGNRWMDTASPTSQAKRQLRMLTEWLRQHGIPQPNPTTGWMTPLVVFTHAEWLKVSECSMPVFDGRRPLLSFLKAQTAQTLTQIQCDQLCDLIVRSPTPTAIERPPTPTPTAPQPPALATRQTGAATPTTVPNCPACGVPMVLRTARRGATAGQQFYGCQNYPRCRAMRPLDPAAHAGGDTVMSAADASIMPASSQPAPGASAHDRCGTCQGDVSRAARFCQHCGAALERGGTA